MLPSIARRTRVCLLLVLVLLALLFSLDAACGQFVPPPPVKPPGGPFGPGGPGNNPTGNNPFEVKYRCSKCGATFTSSTIGGPSSCPTCGVKFINGGFDPLDSPRGPNGPVGPGLNSSKGGGGAVAAIVILGVVGLLFVGFIVVVGLVIFLIIRATRSAAPAATGRLRRRSRFRDDYDA
jgi:DNA-directed RNA polymerase subunit RPC12/RpoP